MEFDACRKDDVLLNGLRVYVRVIVSQRIEDTSTFYSRRGKGPFYEWTFDDQCGVWRCSRLNSYELTSQGFNIASWKSIPQSLQRKLSEHYIE